MTDPADRLRAEPSKAFYGRRRGRRLRSYRAGLMADLLPAVRAPDPLAGTERDPAGWFSQRPVDVWVEIGFGNGEHLAAQALAHRDVGLIGCEPFLNGVAALLDLVQRQGIDNVRIHPDDARPLLDSLARDSVGRAFVLYPDPWPKARHAERRFINPSNLDRLARVMRPGAVLHMATDVPSLAEWMRAQIDAHPDFALEPNAAGDFSHPPPGWLPTRYERKALAAGRQPAYLLARRRPIG